MNNKYLFMVMSGLFLLAWYWVGLMPHYAGEDGGIADNYLVNAILVLMLGGGNGDGDDLISAVIGALTGFVSKFIALGVAIIVARGTYEFLMMGDGGYNAMAIVDSISALAASGVLIICTMACLKRSA